VNLNHAILEQEWRHEDDQAFVKAIGLITIIFTNLFLNMVDEKIFIGGTKMFTKYGIM